MCSLKITPCICYLSDKNLEEQEYLKLFTLYGAIFDATPETISSFTAYAAEQHRLLPRTFQADEIFQIRNQVIRPHAKRVNPYGCYDITRYGAFFNVNVPKEICYSCPYSVSYKNARKETEDLLIAAILHTGNIPDKIKLQMELSNNKAADTIMTSVLAIQGKEKHKGKFDMIRLNSFLLQYLQTDSHLICTENADRISGKIKDSLKTSLLKELETSNSHDYVYEALCKELARITHIDTASSGNEKTLEDIALTLTSPYKYDRNDAVNTIKYTLPQPTDNTVPFLIEPVELPTVSDHVSIIDTAPILPKSAPKSSHNEPTHKTANHTDCHKHHENTVMTDINSKDIPRDPECYYPDNYEIDRSFAEKNVTLIGDIAHLPDLYDGAAPEPGNMVMAHFPEFPFLAETNASYVIAMEKSSLCGVEGLFLYAGGTYYFYILHGSDNKTLKKLLRHRPLIITLNSVELYAALREHRIYEGRITDLKDLYATAAAQDTFPHTYHLLMEKMTGRDFSECTDLYPQAVRYYADVYKVYSEKISDPAESEILEQYTAVSMSVGCSWHTQDTFAGFSSLYKRKNLFEYQSLCPEKLTPKVPGSFYMYHTDDIPAKNEKFYSGLILELVRKESIKLGKVLVLKISDKGLYLFAFETCGLTYEMLQWPCVYLARKLGIKNSLIHYSRKIHTL